MTANASNLLKSLCGRIDRGELSNPAMILKELATIQEQFTLDILGAYNSGVRDGYSRANTRPGSGDMGG